MKGKIAVEDSLTNIRQHLQEHGYHTVDLKEDNLKEVEAVVITGMDENMMNMSDINTKVPVIDARGLSAGEVVDEINELEKIQK